MSQNKKLLIIYVLCVLIGPILVANEIGLGGLISLVGWVGLFLLAVGYIRRRFFDRKSD